MRTLIITTLLGLLASNATAETRLLRFPDLHGDTVVFTYAGDLWLAGTDGSNVRRLTSHPGQELFARFSPDGQHIAFTGQYDGGEQVYVVPVTGGEPKRLTWYPSEGPLPARWGYDHQVYGWTPDGEAVLFRSLREGFSLTGSRLYTVKLSGGLPEALPMVVSGAGALSTDGERILFSPLFRDFRTWKRYERIGLPEHHEPRAHRSRSDVDGGRHLLRLRPRRLPEYLRLRHQQRANTPADPLSTNWTVRSVFSMSAAMKIVSLRSPCLRIPVSSWANSSKSRRISKGSMSAPTVSGCWSLRGAKCSLCLSSTALSGT
jgi:dipeptidyl aminopeptidase/acylaminoacyl peptidase